MIKIKELKIILEEINAASSSIDDCQLDQIIESLHNHKRIFLYAAGRSGLIIRTFAMRLMQSGLQCYVIGETTTPSIHSGDLLILASASGTTRSTCEYAEFAKEHHIETCIITANTVSPLCSLFHPAVVLNTGSKNDSSASSQTMGSLFEQMLLLILDAVILKMNAKKYDEDLKRRHANLE